MPRTLHFCIPGDLDTPTGGYRYDRRILRGLAGLGWSAEHLPLDGSFPDPTATALAQARLAFADLPDGALAVVDGLAFGALPDLAETEGRRLRLVALVHHPLALESGLDGPRAARLRASETRALAQARRVLVTSPATGRLLGDFGVPGARIRVVEPGTDPVSPRPPNGPVAADPDLRLLAVGALVPRKGQDLLLHALARLRDRPWRLACVGSPERDPVWARRLLALRDSLGLAGRVDFVGVLDDAALARRYAQADLFVLPSRFEGYGMVFAEALAHGLPILAARAGAVAETVPPAAALLVPPDDLDALAAALARLLDDPGLRARLAAGAQAAGARLPSWAQAAAAFAAACGEVLDEAGHG